MCRFGARTDAGRSVVVNFFIVGSYSCRLRERLSVASDVSSRPNKAYLVVDRSCFVVRDLKEGRSDGLSASSEVRVGRLSANWLEVVKGVGEFCHNLLGSHAAPAKIARPLS